jgi:hypothetical protein
MVPADFGVVWAMAGVDWRIEIDLDGVPLEVGPVSSGAWQSFTLATSLVPGTAHTLTRRIYADDAVLFEDDLSFEVDHTSSASPNPPTVEGVSMVEDHPQPCDWEPLVGSACEADLRRRGCANPIDAFPSYTMAEDDATLLHVVTTATGATEVSWATCPALREVVSWDCPASTCVTITAVGLDGRLGPSVDHCDAVDAWSRGGVDDGYTDDSSTDGASTGGSSDDARGCHLTDAPELPSALLIGALLVRFGAIRGGVVGPARRRRCGSRATPSLRHPRGDARAAGSGGIDLSLPCGPPPDQVTARPSHMDHSAAGPVARG